MASKRRLRRQGCGSKVKYHSLAEAKNASFMISKRLQNGLMHGYKCEFCTYYHVGHIRHNDSLYAQQRRGC